MADEYVPPRLTTIGTLHELTAQAVPPGKRFGFADGFSITDGVTTITAGSPPASGGGAPSGTS